MRGAIDFEAWAWCNPFFSCLMWGPPEARTFVTRHDTTHKASRKLMCETLDMAWKIGRGHGVTEWWAHNGGKYDWLAILEAAVCHLGWRVIGKTSGGSRLIELQVKAPDDTTIRFFDSMAVIPSSLKQAADDFDLPTAKAFTEDDYRIDPRKWDVQRLKIGCQTDCLIVLELLEKVETLAESWGGKLHSTFSQISMSVMKHYLREQGAEKGEEIPRHDKTPLDMAGNAYCRKGYYGGRVEVFHHLPPSLVDIYDVNSSYPFSMTQWLPWQLWGASNTRKDAQRVLELPGEVEGIVEARVTVPAWMEYPPLPKRTEGNAIVFPTGTWTAHFPANELRYAASLGVKVEPLSAWAYSAERPFEGFVETIQAAKRAAKEAGNKAVESFTKYVGNGGYGKLGQAPEIETIFIPSSQREAEEILAADLRRVQRGFEPSVGKLGDETRFLVMRKVQWPKHTHFAAASYIAAYSRILLHREMLRHPGNLYYCDTDSLHLKTGRAPLNVGPALGQWKPEEKRQHARYLAPKMYETHGEAWNGSLHRHTKECKAKGCSEEVIQYKAKGFPLRHRCDEACRNPCVLRNGWQPGTFAAVQEGRAVPVSRMAMAKGQLKRGGAFQRVEEMRAWRGHSTKRRPLEDGSTVPWTVGEVEAKEYLLAVSPASVRRTG